MANTAITEEENKRMYSVMMMMKSTRHTRKFFLCSETRMKAGEIAISKSLKSVASHTIMSPYSPEHVIGCGCPVQELHYSRTHLTQEVQQLLRADVPNAALRRSE
jgi:hypothetical protein